MIVRIAVCILARNEARTIAALLQQLARQTLLRRNSAEVVVHVVANGCTDDTAARATAAAPVLEGTNTGLVVHDLAEGGKSRSWNKAVHELIAPDADFLLFLDSDIVFADDLVLEETLKTLTDAPAAQACSGYPVKDISLKDRKGLVDYFSLLVSKQSRYDGAINGSLYIVRSPALRELWLPDQTPTEDGFLNAMLTTGGFTHAYDPSKVVMIARPSHFYRAHDPINFIVHERRMLVGTIINRWIFELLWSLKLEEPAGLLIKRWNSEQPDWVDRLIADRVGTDRWVIPNSLVFGRLSPRVGQSWWNNPLRLLTGTLATVLTLPPAIAANKLLKQRGAASTW